MNNFVQSSNINIIDITNETKEYIFNLTEYDKYNIHLNTYRNFRNLYLEETDKYMQQSDRFTIEQFNILKEYRQNLRDMINNNHLNFSNSIKVEFPLKPDFIK